MSTTAKAILTNGRGEFFLDEVVLGDPGPGEVLVEIRASGVCHTDYDTMQWGRTIIMGHEGAGIVAECGEGVTHVRAGDRVLLNWAMPCGKLLPMPAGHGKYLRAEAQRSQGAISS